MASKKFVIYLSAPSCSGKSALTSILSTRIPGLYAVTYDHLKWQLAGYNRAQHKALINQLVVGFFEAVCQTGVPILLDIWTSNKMEYSTYSNIAKRYGYEFIPIQLIAPKKVLLQRFRARVIRANQSGSRISVRDEKTFSKTLVKKSFFPSGTPTYDTSKLTMESVANKIIKKLSTR